jgi:hypothetical protein
MKLGAFSMQSDGSLLIKPTETFTQFLSKDLWAETVETQEQSGVVGESKYLLLFTTGRASAVGDRIISFENWGNPTPSLGTIGALTLALQLGRVGRTYSKTDPFSAEDLARIANGIASAERFALETALAKIEEFRSRQDGWKGPDSVGPTARTIEDAKTFAAVVLADVKIEPPHIGLAADGEIVFFWQNPKITIDLTVAGDGTYAYFAKPDVGHPFFEDAAPIAQNLPKEILSLIRRVG